MSQYFSYLAYRTGWLIVGVLPHSWAYGIFNLVALRVAKKNGKGVQRLRRNLAIVTGTSDADVEQVTIEAMKSYMRYWCDTFRIHRWSTNRIASTVTTTNDHLLRDPMHQGKGVVIALPHSGNWDHAGAYFCQEGFPLVTVAEVLKPVKLFRKFLEHRERMGFEVLPFESRTFVTLMRRAKEHRMIALVADRDLSHSGVEVIFFGKRAKMPAGPALLALKTGIPLVAAHVSYTANGIHIDFRAVEVSNAQDEKVALQETVQKIADAFSIGIAAHPQDWHMLQRIWIDEEVYA